MKMNVWWKCNGVIITEIVTKQKVVGGQGKACHLVLLLVACIKNFIIIIKKSHNNMDCFKDMHVALEDVTMEMDLVELCSNDVALCGSVANELKHYIEKLKGIKSPVKQLRQWYKDNTSSIQSSPSQCHVMCEWIAALCIFCPEFTPEPFTYEQAPAEAPKENIPRLVREIFVPHVLKPPLLLLENGTTSANGSTSTKWKGEPATLLTS